MSVVFSIRMILRISATISGNGIRNLFSCWPITFFLGWLRPKKQTYLSISWRTIIYSNSRLTKRSRLWIRERVLVRSCSVLPRSNSTEQVWWRVRNLYVSLCFLPIWRRKEKCVPTQSKRGEAALRSLSKFKKSIRTICLLIFDSYFFQFVTVYSYLIEI